MRAVLVTIAIAAVTHSASADSVEEAAQLHLDRGIAAFEKGDFLGAHREIMAAHDLVPDKPNPYRWLALVEVQLGDCDRARTNIEGFLSRVAEDDARRAEMLRLRELCSRTGSIAIRTTPERAQLRIDGAAVGASPYRSGSFSAGKHTVHAELPGYEPVSRAVVVTAQQSLDVHLALEKPASRWWLVPAIAGAAIVVTGAIYLATRGDEEGTLPGIVCDASGCHPGGP